MILEIISIKEGNIVGGTYLSFLFLIIFLKHNLLFAQSSNDFITVGDFYLNKAEYDSARYYYQHAALNNHNPALQYKIAETYRCVVEPESKLGRSILLKIINNKNIEPLLLSKSCNLLGIHYLHNEQPDSAKTYLEKALLLGESLHYFMPYIELIHYYINVGDLTMASKYAFGGLSKIEKYNDIETLSYIYFQLASLYDELGKSDKMLFYANKALAIEKTKPYSKLLGDIYEIIGLYYGNREVNQHNKQEAFKAIKYYDLSYKHFEKVKQLRGMGFQLIHAAMKKASIDKVEEAKAEFKRAENLFLQLHRPQSMGAYYLSYGDFLFTYNIDKKQGMKNIHKAAKIWEQHKRKTYLAVAYNALSIGYSRLGDYKKSLDFIQKYYQLNEEITSEKAHKELQTLSLKYETEKKDAQLKEQEITILKEKQHFTSLSLIASISIMVVGLLFYLYRVQQKRKLKKLETSFEQTTQQLQSFNYSVSHDLRHPLVSSKGFIQKLSSTLLDDTQKKYLNKINDSINNMNLIIDAMLNLSSIEREEIMIKTIDTELFIHDILDSFSFNGKFIIKDIPKNFRADIRLIRQAFVNLIANAIKYSEMKDSPEIIIEGAVLNNKAQFTITDNGIGFEEKFSDKLFQLFGRLHPNIKGIGVGLVIVKKIIEKHGGSVSANGKINEGASFSFEIIQA